MKKIVSFSVLSLLVACGQNGVQDTKAQRGDETLSLQRAITANQIGADIHELNFESKLTTLNVELRKAISELPQEDIQKLDIITSNLVTEATPFVQTALHELNQKAQAQSGLQATTAQVEKMIRDMLAGIEQTVTEQAIDGVTAEQALIDLLNKAETTFAGDDQYMRNMKALYGKLLDAYKTEKTEVVLNGQDLSIESLKKDIIAEVVKAQEEQTALFDTLYNGADEMIAHRDRLVKQSKTTDSLRGSLRKANWVENVDVGWPDRPRIDFSTDKSTYRNGKFSARVQIPIDIPGVSLALGPEVEFNTTYSTSVALMAHDSPDKMDDNDLFVTQGEGYAPRFNHSTSRRIHFSCNYEVSSTSTVDLAASASFMGIGGGAGTGAKQTNKVTYSSIYRYVPFTNQDGANTTLRDLVRLCETEISSTKMAELEAQLKLAARSLVMVSSKTQCVRSADCRYWHRDMAASWLGNEIYKVTAPGCVVDARDPRNNYCRLRGVNGANCTARDSNGNRTSGWFEYECAADYKCVVEKNGGWSWSKLGWEPAEAKCRPKYNTIEVEIL